MLLSAARTGSNLLMSLLSRHSAIKTYGELFNLDSLPRADLLEALDDPIGYLQRRVYKEQRAGVTAVGFKMFYDHLTQDYFDKMIDVSDAPEDVRKTFRELATFVDANYDSAALHQRFSDAWKFLVDDTSLLVIHLRRSNALDTLISLKTAYLTRRWWTLKCDEGAPPKVRLDPEECRRYFDKLDAQASRSDLAFRAHDRFDITYEDLVDRRDEVLRRLFAFLNVPYEPVSTHMKKQSRVPASARVENYGELKKSFERSKWSMFFE